MLEEMKEKRKGRIEDRKEKTIKKLERMLED